jgi:hypothetical protein
VIATGFELPAASRPSAASPETPVDLTAYTEHVRVRVDTAPVPAAPRPSIARRAPLDLPMTAMAGSALPGAANSAQLSMGESQGGLAEESASPFDVPAFLRRQDG